MNYVSGFIIPVPQANKQKFIDYANRSDSIFIEMGALRVMECWEEEVPTGKHTDFRRAVQAKEDEAVVFSWVEWPDKATCDAAMQKMTAGEAKDDPRLDPKKNPMPLDGSRMIFGDFKPVAVQTP